MHPDHYGALTGLAESWDNKGSVLDRINMHESAIKANEEAVNAYNGAIEVFDEIIKLNQNHLLVLTCLVEAHNNKGQVLERLGKRGDATNSYAKADLNYLRVKNLRNV